MHRKNDRQFETSELLEQHAETLDSIDVLGSVKRGQNEASGGNPETAQKILLSSRDRESTRGDVHNGVSGDRDPRFGDAFGEEVVPGLIRRRETQVRQMIGEDAVVLLRHEPIEASQTGLDMRQRNFQGVGRQRASQGRIGIALYHDQRRTPLRELLLEAEHKLANLLRSASPPRPNMTSG